MFSSAEDFTRYFNQEIAPSWSGIDIPTAFQWIIEGIEDEGRFLISLLSLLDPGSTLYLEGDDFAHEIAAFYTVHNAQRAATVPREILSPSARFFHVSFSQEVTAQLLEFARTPRRTMLFDVFKGYHGDTMVFAYHRPQCRISGSVPEAIIAKMANDSKGTLCSDAEIEAERCCGVKTGSGNGRTYGALHDDWQAKMA